MILVSMERGEPILYYGTKQLYFGCANFKFTGDGNHPQNTCYKNGSGRRGLKIEHNDNQNYMNGNVFLRFIVRHEGFIQQIIRTKVIPRND